MSRFPDASQALRDPSLPFSPAGQGCNQISVATCRRAKTLFPEEEMPGPTGQPLPSAPLTQSTQESGASETKLSSAPRGLGKPLCFSLRAVFPRRSSPEKACGHHCIVSPFRETAPEQSWGQRHSALGETEKASASPRWDKLNLLVLHSGP